MQTAQRQIRETHFPDRQTAVQTEQRIGDPEDLILYTVRKKAKS